MRAIVSVTRDWGIGMRGSLLVPNRADMRRFVELTRGGVVVMGRTTFETLPAGPLKGRRNIVLTRREDYAAEGIEVAHGMAEALDLVGDCDPDQVWVIGGEAVYREFMPCCSHALVTRNDVVVEADAFFPNLDEDPCWEPTSREGAGITEAGVAYEFVTYAQIGKTG